MKIFLQALGYCLLQLVQLIITVCLCVFLVWLIFCLHATFNNAKAAQPAIVRVLGTPSAFRVPDDIYMRWHQYWNWCD